VFSVMADILVRARRRFARWRSQNSGPFERPEKLWVVSGRLTALLSPVDSPMSTSQVLITALNSQIVVCRSPNFIREGDRLNLEMRVPDGSSIDMEVRVEWVDISGVAHRLGLIIVNPRRSQNAWRQLCFGQDAKAPG